jgi:hypothetical protein
VATGFNTETAGITIPPLRYVKTRETTPSPWSRPGRFSRGDRWGDCPCGAPYLAEEEHFHTSSPEKVADAIIRHLGEEGGTITLLRQGEVVMSIDLPEE